MQIQNMENFLEAEVREAIHALKQERHRSGPTLPSEMLQPERELSKNDAQLCNNIYEEKKCPRWGRAIIVPIHKNGDKKCAELQRYQSAERTGNGLYKCYNSD